MALWQLVLDQIYPSVALNFEFKDCETRVKGNDYKYNTRIRAQLYSYLPKSARLLSITLSTFKETHGFWCMAMACKSHSYSKVINLCMYKYQHTFHTVYLTHLGFNQQ